MTTPETATPTVIEADLQDTARLELVPEFSLSECENALVYLERKNRKLYAGIVESAGPGSPLPLAQHLRLVARSLALAELTPERQLFSNEQMVGYLHELEPRLAELALKALAGAPLFLHQVTPCIAVALQRADKRGTDRKFPLRAELLASLEWMQQAESVEVNLALLAILRPASPHVVESLLEEAVADAVKNAAPLLKGIHREYRDELSVAAFARPHLGHYVLTRLAKSRTSFTKDELAFFEQLRATSETKNAPWLDKLLLRKSFIEGLRAELQANPVR